MIPLFEVLFGESPPRISKYFQEAFFEIRDWFVEEKFSFIMIYGSEARPHVFPRYILDRIVVREIANHITLHVLR